MTWERLGGSIGADFRGGGKRAPGDDETPWRPGGVRRSCAYVCGAQAANVNGPNLRNDGGAYPGASCGLSS